ncbi:MAG: 16S rRNA (uracil(1498)-N(3))-methyltransferase [Oxalobacter sp.]|nr:16S rRNA (uracil(1498)-N(3))-methyltransferase [Oxalobacter sp.]
MTRLFCDFPLAIGENIELPKDAARHIMVLRLSAGDPLTLFNGLGGEYHARITRIDRKQVVAEIVSHSSREAELPYRITLAQGIPEATKMDWIIEKAVELGVSDIIPLAAQRSVVRLDKDRAEKRLSRWQAIAISAAQQCGRNRLPHIASPVGTGEYLRQTTPSPRILFSPRATETLSEWARHQKPQNITLLIGPEGGFSPEEENMAEQQGVTFLSMGPRILRTETAGLAGVGAINAQWETPPG